MRARISMTAFMVAAAALLVGATPATAQKVELTPFFGYQFGGELRVRDGDLRLQDDVNYGLVLDVALNRNGQLEVSYTRQDTRIEYREFNAGTRPIYDVSVNYWQIGGVYEFEPTATARPFLSLTGGFTYYGVGDQLDDDAPIISSDTFFSMVLGGGVKIFPSQRIGIRLAGHLYSTIVSSSSGFWCTLPGGCGVGLSGWGIWQGDVQAGLTFAF
jgi:hypothetical protein